LRLKSKIEEQNSHVKKASRIVGVIEFEDGDPQGRAEYVGQILRDGSLVAGEEFADGVGCMNWVDGTLYAGEFESDQVHGVGEETYEDGSYYLGQFENGTRHGRGVYRSSTVQYRGWWENGEKHGLGILTSLATNVHVLGKFVNDEFERRVDDVEAEKLLKEQTLQKCQDAREVATMAKSIAPTIFARTSEFQNEMLFRQGLNAYLYAAFFGPLLIREDSVSPLREGPNQAEATEPSNACSQDSSLTEETLEFCFVVLFLVF
jgi:hypothetical protein